MRQLVLTGLGNEVDLKTGRTIFTAVFNGDVRIEISKEAAQVLTNSIYGGEEEQAPTPSQDDYKKPPDREPEPEGEEFGGNLVNGAPVLEDVPNSVYDEDTGVEQV